jgi:predicted enzyme related to lactoylglutathione lyase
MFVRMERLSLALIEFPADEPERALRFWGALLGASLECRSEGEGEGWQSRSAVPPVGLHPRGRGPGDSFSLPYFAVDDLPQAKPEARPETAFAITLLEASEELRTWS